MMGRDTPIQCRLQCRIFRRNSPRAMSASVDGSSSPAIIALSIARPEAPSGSVATDASFTFAIFKHLLDSVRDAIAFLAQRDPIARQIPQFADRRRRDEAALQQSMLQ